MRQGLGIFVTLIMILSVTGVAYAHWSETLYISGTVKTGSLDAKWSAGPSWDTEPPEKDVSSITCWVDPSDESGHTLIVQVSNAYPSIDYYQLIDLHNTGTIPLHIWSIDIDDEGMPEGSTIEILDVDNVNVPEEHQGYVTSDLDIDVCEQIHPDETAYGVLHVHLPQSAEQGAKYTFTVTVVVVQWNESCPEDADGDEDGEVEVGSGDDFEVMVDNPGHDDGDDNPGADDEDGNPGIEGDNPDEGQEEDDSDTDGDDDNPGAGDGESSGSDDEDSDVGDEGDNSDEENNPGAEGDSGSDEDDYFDTGGGGDDSTSGDEGGAGEGSGSDQSGGSGSSDASGDSGGQSGQSGGQGGSGTGQGGNGNGVMGGSGNGQNGGTPAAGGGSSGQGELSIVLGVGLAILFLFGLVVFLKP